MGLAEAVLRLQDRLDVPVFLRPVAGVRDLSAAIEKDPAHLVVTDARLGQQGPRGDPGVERRVGELEAVRRAHPGLPVRVVSGHPGPAFPRRLRRAGAFRDACVLVAGEDHEAVDEQGGSACVALELTVRWSGRPAASGGLPGRPGSSEGPAPVIGPHDPAPDPELTHLLEDRRKAAMQAARKRGAPEDIVEDAGGHLTLKAVERAGRDRTPLKELRVKGPFTPSYAWTAGWNYAADQLARKDRQHLSPPEGERSTTTDDEWLSLSDPEARRDLVTETPPPDAAVPFVEPIKRLEAVVEALPERRRTVVWLRRFGALPQKEVARVLDTTANAVKLQARRAWRAVKVRLGNPEL